MAVTKKLRSITASFDSKAATADSAHKVVDYILRQSGCSGCGRLSLLEVAFASDPPEPAIPGVTSVQSAE
jgi:hypothetical protein